MCQGFSEYNDRVSPMAIVPFEVNDIVHLRKPHACGGYEWRVVRVGADIGLKCLTCGRRVLLPRSEVQRRMLHRTSAPRDAQAKL